MIELWHLDAGKSTGFIKDMGQFDATVRDVPRLTEVYESSDPSHGTLYRHRVRPK